MIFSLRKQGSPCQTFSSKPELTSAVSLRKQGPCALCRHCLHNEWPLVPWNPQASPMIGGQERISVHEKKNCSWKKTLLEKICHFKKYDIPCRSHTPNQAKKGNKAKSESKLNNSTASVDTGKSLSEGLIFAWTNPQYEDRFSPCSAKRRASDKDLFVQI